MADEKKPIHITLFVGLEFTMSNDTGGFFGQRSPFATFDPFGRFDFDSQFGVQTPSEGTSSDAKGNAQSASLVELVELLKTTNPWSQINCVTLGDVGSGKTEIVCMFDDIDRCLAGQTDGKHAKRSSGEMRKVCRLGRGSISFSDGLGTPGTKLTRFKNIEEYIKGLATNVQEVVSIPLLCIVAVNLAGDFTESRSKNLLRAELRLFKRQVLNSTSITGCGKSISEILTPKFLFVGTHLDKIKGNIEAIVQKFNDFVDDITLQEEYSAAYPYRVIASDIYSENGRKEFLKEFLLAKNELFS